MIVLGEIVAKLDQSIVADVRAGERVGLYPQRAVQ